MKFVKFRQKFRGIFLTEFREILEILLLNLVILNIQDKKVLLYEQAIFTTFIVKMAADSLHFVIYCFKIHKSTMKNSSKLRLKNSKG